MNRIDFQFKNLLHNSGKKAVIVFTTAGDPSLKITGDFIRFCEDAGVDIVEVGIPFSDPIADGPTIQASSFRSLKKGVRVEAIADLCAGLRGKKGLKMPLVWMSSVNPLYHRGPDKSARLMKQSGVDGVILPDLPSGEDEAIYRSFEQNDVRTIRLITPTTDKKRQNLLLKKSNGFLYYVSVVGLTGALGKRSYGFADHIKQIKKKTKTPVCVGFGISNPAQAAKAASLSDGIIIGSAVVSELNKHSKTRLQPSTKKFIRDIVRAVKNI